MHYEIIDLGVKLGYFQDRKGACAGVTMAWISACLTNDEQEAKYLRFTKEIAENGSILFDKITQMQTKVSRKEKLSEDEKELFQYLAFYEQIKLYLSPMDHQKLFGKSINQDDVEVISQIANSTALEEKGGMSVVYSDTDLYTKDELIIYLTGLVESLPSDTGIIALALSSHNHGIGLIYNPQNASWKFMDINQGNPQELPIRDLAEKIFNGFNLPVRDPRNEYTALRTLVITADEPLKRDLLKISFHAFNEFYRKKYPIALHAGRKSEVNLLWIAAQNGDLDAVKASLDAKNDINQVNENGATPLFAAAQNGHIEIAKALLTKEGIEINKALPDGETPLYIAAQNGHIEVAKPLLATKGIEINKARTDGATPLYIAAKQGHIEVVNALRVTEGIDINKPKTNGVTPLFIAAQNGHIEVVKALLATKEIEINKARTSGVTPLFIAAQIGHIEVVKALLATEGMDINKALLDGVTPLYIAAQNGHIEVVNALLATKEIDINKPRADGATPLFIAAYRGHIEIVKALLSTKGIDINKSRTDGITPLLISAEIGHIEVFKALLATEGVCINMYMDKSKQTASSIKAP